MPLTERAGVWVAYWTANDYCQFFARTHRWPATETMSQPVGFLDRVADSIIQTALEQQPEQGPTATESLVKIAGKGA